MTDNQSRHVSIVIAADAGAVFAYVRDPRNLPRWAAGLAGATIEQVDGRWVTESDLGRVEVQFAPPNEFGVLDHVVTLPDGTPMLNPMRVLPHDDGAEVTFTVRRRAMTDAELDRDAAAVAADLASLKEILER